MHRLFEYADEYLLQSTWKTLAALKFCLCAMGILIGLALPKQARRTAAFAAAVVFVGTYIPLMLKLVDVHRSLTPYEEETF